MNIDCVLFYLPYIKDTVLTMAAIVGGYAALQGLSTWNRQLKGGVEYDLARRILKCTYRLREAINGVRHPVMWGDERPVPSELEAARMSKDQIRHYGLGGAYQKRWNKVTKIRTELQTELLEAEAIWGRTVYEKFEPVFKLQQELFSSVQIFLLACDPNESKQARDANQDIFTKGRDILYNRSLEKPDPFTKDITNAIKTIEDFLRPHLKK